MNIMNFTQPDFNRSPKASNTNYQSIISFNHPNFEIVLTKQAYRTADNIKNSLRIGKLKKNYYRNFKPDRQRYNLTKIDNQPTQDLSPKDFQINARKINNISKKLPEEVSFDAFVRQQKQKNSKYLNQMRTRLIKEAQRTLYSKNNKSVEYKRKLSPLKKGSLTLQKKVPKKQLKIAFLNIQKAPLLKFIQKQALNQQQEIAPSALLEAWNSEIDSINFQRNINKSQIKNLSGTTDDFYRQQKRKKPLLQDIGLSTLKNFRKFIPPFQRYYYRDFLWKIAYSNNILFQSPKQYEKKFKVFIGKGNNSLLIKSLMKRRSQWWAFTDRYDQANFIWTQIKINDIFKKQQSFLKSSQQKQLAQQQVNLPPSNNFKKKSTYQFNRKILNQYQTEKMEQYFIKHRKLQQKLEGTMAKRNRIMKKSNLLKLDSANIKIHNHLTNNYIIGNKKALYYTMTSYYQKIGENPFQYLPETYHIQNGLQDPQYMKFLSSYYPRQKMALKEQKEKSPQKHRIKNIWIVKPGEFTNRGNGINVCLNLQEIKKIVKTKQVYQNGNQRTYIIQSYIDKPFLYQRRKFDIRHYMMITSVNGHIKGYWYQLGYIRTTSYEYSVKTNFSSIHLTNDAVQKYLPDYGKYQKGNKLTYQVFQAYLDREYNGKYNFFEQIYPKMKKIATDAIRASSLSIDPDRKGHNFQVFGMDFMIDQNFKPWLIQINNNPCLELSCPYLSQIIPAMVQNALKICVDSLIPPPAFFQQKRPKFSDNVLQTNKFQLVYDSIVEQENIRKILMGQSIVDKVKQLQNQDDQIFQDDGKQLQD